MDFFLSKSRPLAIFILFAITVQNQFKNLEAIVGGQVVYDRGGLDRLVQVTCEEMKNKRCCGWLVAERYVVTAPNCVIHTNSNNQFTRKCKHIVVRMKSSDWGNGTILKVVNVMHHSQPQLDKSFIHLNTELATLKLDHKVKGPEFTGCSTSLLHQIEKGAEGVFFGWGKTAPNLKENLWNQRVASGPQNNGNKRLVFPKQLRSMNMTMPKENSNPLEFHIANGWQSPNSPLEGDEGCPLIINRQAAGIAIQVPDKYYPGKTRTVFAPFFFMETVLHKKSCILV